MKLPGAAGGRCPAEVYDSPFAVSVHPDPDRCLLAAVPRARSPSGPVLPKEGSYVPRVPSDRNTRPPVPWMTGFSEMLYEGSAVGNGAGGVLKK